MAFSSVLHIMATVLLALPAVFLLLAPFFAQQTGEDAGEEELIENQKSHGSA